MILPNASEPARWQVAPPPFVNELLSSFLVRAAHQNRMSPHVFCARFYPGSRVWTGDVDCFAQPSLIRTIATDAQLSMDETWQLTLPFLFAEHDKPQRHPSAWKRWTMPLGIRSSDLRYGLQYCPHCLEDEAYFRRWWRLSFVCICPVHNRVLLDRCPRCSLPVRPWRRARMINCCSGCGADLRAARAIEDYGPTAQPYTAIQTFWQDLLSAQEVEVDGIQVQRADYFRGANLVLRALKECIRARPGCMGSFPARGAHPSLDAVNHRISAYTVLAHVMHEWPANFLQLCESLGVTRGALLRAGSVPAWMENGVSRVRDTGRRRRVWTSQALRQRIEQIEMGSSVSRRSERAGILMHAALESARGH